MGRDHHVFARNGEALNKHFTLTSAATPVVRMLLGAGVKVNTSFRNPARGRRIVVNRTKSGLTIRVCGDGIGQTIHAITSNPVEVEALLDRKFGELIVK